MRIAIVDWYYDAVLDGVYADRPELAHSSYRDQLEALMGLCFGTADAISVHLRDLGHDAFDIVMNCVPLQRQWAAEHASARLLRRLPVPKRGKPRGGASLLLGRRVLLEQIDFLDPDVVYMQKLNVLLRSDLRRLRREGRLLVGHFGVTPPWRLLPEYDLIVTNMPHLAERARENGVDAHYLPHAFYELAAERVAARGRGTFPESGTRDIAIAFVGTVHPPHIARSGIERLERLCEQVGLQIWGTLSAAVPARSPIRAHYRGPAWGLDMYEVLARTRITVNRHTDVNQPYACNCRIFEGTGMGALMLTESARNLPPLFEPGSEIITYSNTEDLVQKARYYLEHDGDRQRVARGGQARALDDHTYTHRVEELATLIHEALDRRGAG